MKTLTVEPPRVVPCAVGDLRCVVAVLVLVQEARETLERRVRSHPPGTECALRGLVKSNSITTTWGGRAATQPAPVTPSGVAHANAAGAVALACAPPHTPGCS